MTKSFDQIMHDYKEVFSETYFGYSPLMPHQLPLQQESVCELISGTRVTLTTSPGIQVERLYLDERTLLKVSKEQFVIQFKNLIFQTFIYTSQPEDFQPFLNELSQTIEVFLNDFNNPVFFSNSSSKDWGSWNQVTHNMKDMFLVCMDSKSVRYVLGVNAD